MMAKRFNRKDYLTFIDLFKAGKLDELKTVIKSGLEEKEIQHISDTFSSPLSIPLIEAAHRGIFDFVQFLFDHFEEYIDINCGADTQLIAPQIIDFPNYHTISYESITSLPPLVAACTNDDVKMVQYLVSKGADLNKQAPHLGSSLHVAAQYGCLSVMKYLVDNGVDINRTNYKGCTPLMMMCGLGISPSRTLRILMKAWKDNKDNKNIRDVYDFLVSNGANIHHKSLEGYTIMHEAARFGRVDIIKLLLSYGLSPMFSNDSTTSECYVPCPLYLAADNGHEHIIEYFCGLESCPGHCKSNAYLLLASSIGCYLSNKKELWEIGIASLDGLNPKIVYPLPIPEYEYIEEFSTKKKLNEVWETKEFRTFGHMIQHLLIRERCLSLRYLPLLESILRCASEARDHNHKIEGLCQRALKICSVNCGKQVYSEYVGSIFKCILQLAISFEGLPDQDLSLQYLSELALCLYENNKHFTNNDLLTQFMLYCFECWLNMLCTSDLFETLNSLPSYFHTLGRRMMVAIRSQPLSGLEVFYYLKTTVEHALPRVRVHFLEALLFWGAQEVINTPDVTNYGKRPLHILVEPKEMPVEVISVLLSNAAHVDAVDELAKMPLDYCSHDSPIHSLLLSTVPLPLSCYAARTIVSEGITYKCVDLPKHLVPVIELHDPKSIK